MRTYCMKFYIPVYHSGNGDRAAAHRHTVEVAVYVRRDAERFEPFSEMEKSVEACLRPYGSCYLNDREEFREDASMERLGDVLFSRLAELMEERKSSLLRLEIGETPLRKYAVGILEPGSADRMRGSDER